MDYITKEEQLYKAVQLLKNGNQESYSEIYNLSLNYTHKLVLDITQNEETTYVILPQVYQDIYSSINVLEQPELFFSWAGQIATTDTVNYLRGNGYQFTTGCSADTADAKSADAVTEYFAEAKRRLYLEVFLKIRKDRGCSGDMWRLLMCLIRWFCSIITMRVCLYIT